MLICYSSAEHAVMTVFGLLCGRVKPDPLFREDLSYSADRSKWTIYSCGGGFVKRNLSQFGKGSGSSGP